MGPEESIPWTVEAGGLPDDSSNASVRPLLPVAVVPQPVPGDADLRHPSLFFNRELSWIDFNWRVLYQALNDRTPLLERARFLAITQGNLDEFFGKRVAGLKSLLRAGVMQRSADGRTPAEQLKLIREAVLLMQQRMTHAWEYDVRPALERETGAKIVAWNELSESEKRDLTALFRSNIYPILTPLAVDPAHPFPFISNLSLSLAITLIHPRRGTEHFARVKLPLKRGRWVRIGDTNRYIAIEQLVAEHVPELFRGMKVKGTYLFRVTRSTELEYDDDDEAEDLLELIAGELRERRFAPVVRLEVDPTMPDAVRELLLRELELTVDDVYEIDGLLDLTSLSAFADMDIPALRYAPWEPVVPAVLKHVGESETEADIFAVIRAGDVLVHHPYESFTASVVRFIEDAAADPQVLALKQTLYRISDDSRVARALIRAAEAGKQVAVLVELTASLDEERNINWAQRMENAGVHVTYGIVGLKTHTKITLVVREEPDAIRTYCHIGTGNYHERTAKFYTDIGWFSCSPAIGNDIVNLFHFLTGMAPEQQYENLLVAPRYMRCGLKDLIAREMALGRRGRIIMKMNGTDDVEMIEQLYLASRAGVQIDLLVRGHSRLRPGVPGISDNIRVISIIGRFLEHGRIFYFHNDGSPEVYIGSADLRRRNLDDRVEVLARIDDPRLKRRLRQILDLALADNTSSWELRADGRYVLRHGTPACNFQEILMQRAIEGLDR